MSRWDADSDLDYYDEPWARGNAECSDCGQSFTKGPADVGTLCDGCCSRRDEHTSALQIRMAMAQLRAKASAVPVVVDVALVADPAAPIGPVVDVALVVKQSGQFDEMRIFAIRRIAAAVLAVDLTTIREVA